MSNLSIPVLAATLAFTTACGIKKPVISYPDAKMVRVKNEQSLALDSGPMHIEIGKGEIVLLDVQQPHSRLEQIQRGERPGAPAVREEFRIGLGWKKKPAAEPASQSSPQP